MCSEFGKTPTVKFRYLQNKAMEAMIVSQTWETRTGHNTFKEICVLVTATFISKNLNLFYLK